MTENNKLIAEFMGFNFNRFKDDGIIEPQEEVFFTDYKTFTLEELRFNKDWNWLMEVVERIESLGVNFWIVKNKVKLTIVGELAKKLSDSLYDTEFEGYDFEYYIEGTKIEATYQAVVEFIKWYNN